MELYTQFEVGREGRKGINDYILEHSQLYQTEESRKIDKKFVNELVASLDTDSHILLVSVVEKIRRNLIILEDKDNRFTRLQVFLCLQDLCLAVENALKVKNSLQGLKMKEILDRLFSKNSGRVRDPWKKLFDGN